MLPTELHSNIFKCSNESSKELSNTEEWALFAKKTNLALCKELIYSCTENKSSSDSKTLSEKNNTLCGKFGSQNLKSFSSTCKKKKVSFGKNEIRCLKDSHKSKKSRKHFNSRRKSNHEDLTPLLKLSTNQSVSFSKRPDEHDKKHTLLENLSLNKLRSTLTKKKPLKMLQRQSTNKILSSQKCSKGLTKNAQKEHVSTKNYKKHIKHLKSEFKNDFYGEKLLNILDKYNHGCSTPSVDKRLNLIVCCLSMMVYKKYRSSLFNQFEKNDCDAEFNDKKLEPHLLRKRIISMSERLKNLSFSKHTKENKYLRVSLKKLPDCIFNHFKNQNASTFSELPNYLCSSCKIADVHVVVFKLPDKIFSNYKKGKPIMVSNLPSSILYC